MGDIYLKEFTEVGNKLTTEQGPWPLGKHWTADDVVNAAEWLAIKIPSTQGNLSLGTLPHSDDIGVMGTGTYPRNIVFRGSPEEVARFLNSVMESDNKYPYGRTIKEKIGEYRTNIVVFVPSTDSYHGVSGFGRTANESQTNAFGEAGRKYGTFTNVTHNEYLHLPSDVRNAVKADWETYREQVTRRSGHSMREADISNYIVYTREIAENYYCPAIVTQDLRQAKFVAEDMRKAGYEEVVVVEAPQAILGLNAPKLMKPEDKYKRISDAMTPDERKMYDGLPTEDSKIPKEESMQPHGDERYMTEDEKKRLAEQPAPKDIKVKHPGILGLKPDEFMKKKSAYFVSLAKKKGAGPIQKALLNLERWNKNDDPEISKRARVHIDAIKKALGK